MDEKRDQRARNIIFEACQYLARWRVDAQELRRRTAEEVGISEPSSDADK